MLLFALLFALLIPTAAAQTTPQPDIQAEVTHLSLTYQGRSVSGRRLLVRTELPLPLDSAWAWVQTPALLQHVARGKVRFKPYQKPLPPRWQQGDTVAVRMWLYGFLPFGGVHYLHVKTVDPRRHLIQSREWDRRAKVWHHDIRLTALGPDCIRYEDEIIIYGGALTGLITWWAKGFYQHRQRRWHRLARKGKS